MSNSTTLLIRADATPRMGTGHVMRCLALAQAARREGFDVHMICRLGVDWLRDRLAREDIPLHILSDTPPAAEDSAILLEQLQGEGFPLPGELGTPIWVVLDGYHFDADCQQAVMRAGYRLLVIDDYAHLPEYHCDVLLNQNIGAEHLTYHGSIGRKLLGLDYVLLRQEFWDAREKAQQRLRPTQPQNILVTLGGGNFIEHLEKIAVEMHQPELAGRTIRVIQGGMNADRIRAAFACCPAQLEILSRVDDMPSLLLDTDLCITAGGSTCWELCCLGVPFLTVIVAENQRDIVEQLFVQYNVHPFSSSTLTRFLSSSFSTQPQIQIKSIINKLLTLYHDIFFVNATMDDMNFVFSLANDPDVRQMSFKQHKISWAEHEKWFTNMITKKNTFFIMLYKNKKCGYARFNNNNITSEIAIAIEKNFRGKGLGKILLREVSLKTIHETSIKNITASVKKENIPSLCIFSQAYYTQLARSKTSFSSVVNFAFPHRTAYAKR